MTHQVRLTPRYPFSGQDNHKPSLNYIVYNYITGDGYHTSATYLIPWQDVVQTIFTSERTYVRVLEDKAFEANKHNEDAGELKRSNLTDQDLAELLEFADQNSEPVTRLSPQGVKIVGVLELLINFN